MVHTHWVCIMLDLKIKPYKILKALQISSTVHSYLHVHLSTLVHNVHKFCMQSTVIKSPKAGTKYRKPTEIHLWKYDR